MVQTVAVHESKDYRTEFKGTPLDLTRLKIYFMIGNHIPMEMIIPVSMDIKWFKQKVLALRNEAKFIKQYFDGLDDPNELKVYEAGSYGEGEPLPDDILVPRDSSPYKHLAVMR